jgi:hypothetical protein
MRHEADPARVVLLVARIEAVLLQMGNFGRRRHGVLLQWGTGKNTAAQQRCQAKQLGSDSN